LSTVAEWRAGPLPVGVVVADEPGAQGPGEVLREMLPLTGQGTDCIRPEQIVLPGTAPLPRLPVLQVRADPGLLFPDPPTARLPLPAGERRLAAEPHDDAGYLAGHRQERGVRGVEDMDGGRVGGEGGVGVSDESLLQGRPDDLVLGADHVGAGH
jgi:hypothetical protein